MKNIFFILLSLAFINNAFAQTNSDQDLITLKNGYQYLGYIIEMQPGKSIKMYRPVKNDTIIINMEDVEIRSVVSGNVETAIENSAIKSNQKNGKRRNEATGLNRFNNKLNVNQFSFCMASNFWEYDFLKGFGYTYYRNFKNKYYLGASSSMMGNFSGSGWKDPNFSSGMYFSKDSSLSMRYTTNQRLIFVNMVENKINILFWRPQKRRLSLFLGLNLGYVFDFSEAEGYAESYSQASPLVRKKEYDFIEKCQGNFIFQTTLCLKINPDNNSGIIIEPGCAFYNPTVYTTTNQSGSFGNYKFAGNTYIDTPLFLTGRISYFF